MEPAAADGQVVMAGMDVGWSDVGTWRALLDALVGGYHGAARVIPPGEVANLEAADFAVRRADDGLLRLESGPADLTSTYPIGLLPGARPHREVLATLVERVNQLHDVPAQVSA
jgi:hypothetical protein